MMWSYYGAKTNVVKSYPPPKHGKIIEPFAGTARYALYYWEREVVLVDKFPVIVSIWKWLQKCSKEDILKLPRKLSKGQTLNDFTFDCQEAKWLMGFLIKKGVERPAITPTDWVTVQRPNFTNFSLQRIASNLHKIKHWEIVCADYESIPNEKATWYIDPPYEFGGAAYVMSNRDINFERLAEWCKGRQGQVIVCENSKANWMDFIPLKKQKGTKRSTTEVLWTNEETSYKSSPIPMF
jgi:site-specific DNA-adenine methylase